jgi:hypothetical protein
MSAFFEFMSKVLFIGIIVKLILLIVESMQDKDE